STHKESSMATLTIKPAPARNDKLRTTLQVAGCIGVALLLALMLGVSLGGDWPLPMDPAVAPGFTASAPSPADCGWASAARRLHSRRPQASADCFPSRQAAARLAHARDAGSGESG